MSAGRGQDRGMTVPRPPAPWLIRPVKLPATTPPPLTGPWSPGRHPPRRRRAAAAAARPRTGGRRGRPTTDTSTRVRTTGHIWRWQPDAHAGAARPCSPTPAAGRWASRSTRATAASIVCDAYRGLLRVTDDGTITDLTPPRPAAAASCSATTPPSPATAPSTSPTAPTASRSRTGDATCSSTDPTDASSPTTRRPAAPTSSPRASTSPTAWHSRRTRTPCCCARRSPTACCGCRCRTAPCRSWPICRRTRTTCRRSATAPTGSRWPARGWPSPRSCCPTRPCAAWPPSCPPRLQPQPLPHIIAALVDGDGRVLRTLHGPAGRYTMATGVRQHGDTLWLGSLTERAIARAQLS